MKFVELEVVRLLKDQPQEGLKAGELGTIIVAFPTPNEAYEVEFVDNDGRTRAQLVLLPDEIEKYIPDNT